MKNIIDIVFTCDKNYYIPVTVSMTSVVLNLSDGYCARFHLFIKGLDKEVEGRFLQYADDLKCKILFYKMEEYEHLFSDVDVSKFANQYINIVCYYRLLMLKILPDEVHKCFYIDGDVIVDTDLSHIYDEIKPGDIASVVVETVSMQNRKHLLTQFVQWPECSKFKDDPDLYPYFNAGFFLLNVDLAKKKGLWGKYKEFYKRHPNPKYADQDILNVIIGQQRPGNIIILSAEYNVFCDCDDNPGNYPYGYYSFDEIKFAFENPKIYHYGGCDKPWLGYVRHYYSKWFEYASKSPVTTDAILLLAENIENNCIAKKDINEKLTKYEIENNYLKKHNNELMKENIELNELKSKLENSTIKAVKNVICSLIRKMNK